MEVSRVCVQRNFSPCANKQRSQQVETKLLPQPTASNEGGACRDVTTMLAPKCRPDFWKGDARPRAIREPFLHCGKMQLTQSLGFEVVQHLCLSTARARAPKTKPPRACTFSSSTIHGIGSVLNALGFSIRCSDWAVALVLVTGDAETRKEPTGTHLVKSDMQDLAKKFLPQPTASNEGGACRDVTTMLAPKCRPDFWKGDARPRAIREPFLHCGKMQLTQSLGFEVVQHLCLSTARARTEDQAAKGLHVLQQHIRALVCPKDRQADIATSAHAFISARAFKRIALFLYG